MAESRILIKRTASVANIPVGTLQYGELAYSFATPGGDKLYIGDSAKNAVAIGGKYYADYIDTIADSYVKLVRPQGSTTVSGIQISSTLTYVDGGTTTLKDYVEAAAGTAASVVDDVKLTVHNGSSDPAVALKIKDQMLVIKAGETNGQIGVTLGADGSFTIDTSTKLATHDEAAAAYTDAVAYVDEQIRILTDKDEVNSFSSQLYTYVHNALGFTPQFGEGISEDSKKTVITEIRSNIQTALGATSWSDTGYDIIGKLDNVEQVAADAAAAAVAELGQVYNVKGSLQSYSDLISLSTATDTTKRPKTGDVWNVVEAVTLTLDEGNTKAGSYPAGTNWVWIGPTEATEGADGIDGHWDPLGGAVDLSVYATTSDFQKVKNELLGGGEGFDGNIAEGAGIKTKAAAAYTTANANKTAIGTVEDKDGSTLWGALYLHDQEIFGHTNTDGSRGNGLVKNVEYMLAALGMSADGEGVGSGSGNLIGRIATAEDNITSLKVTVGVDLTPNDDYYSTSLLARLGALESEVGDPSGTITEGGEETEVAATGLHKDIEELQKTATSLTSKIEKMLGGDSENESGVVFTSGYQDVKDKSFTDVVSIKASETAVDAEGLPSSVLANFKLVNCIIDGGEF